MHLLFFFFKEFRDFLEPSLFFILFLVPFVSGNLAGWAPLVKPDFEGLTDTSEEFLVTYVHLAFRLKPNIHCFALSFLFKDVKS